MSLHAPFFGRVYKSFVFSFLAARLLEWSLLGYFLDFPAFLFFFICWFHFFLDGWRSERWHVIVSSSFLPRGWADGPGHQGCLPPPSGKSSKKGTKARDGHVCFPPPLLLSPRITATPDWNVFSVSRFSVFLREKGKWLLFGTSSPRECCGPCEDFNLPFFPVWK